MNVGDRPEMTLRDYWRVVTSRWWIVLAAIVATTVPAVALSMSQARVYQADADMLIRASPGESVFGSGDRQNVSPDRTLQNEITILQGDLVYARLKQNLGLVDDPPGVSGSGFTDADVITVTVESGDPSTAASLANGYVKAYIDTKRDQAVQGMTAASAQLQGKIAELQPQIAQLDAQIAANPKGDTTSLESDRRTLVDQQSLFKQRIDQLQVDAALSAGNAELVRPAVAPAAPVKPTPRRTALLAAVVGLLLGLGAAFLIDYLDDVVRDADDLVGLGAELPVLANIPNVSVRDNARLSIAEPYSPAVEAYRNLRTNVQFLGVERKLRVIQVTSTRPGEGKTTTAANLAVVLSQAGSKVVLVDADLRKPEMHRMFAVDAHNGLTNNLAGDPMELTMQRVNDHLTVIVGGPVPPNPSELLSGRRMDAFIAELAIRFEYVIIDSAPTLAVSDAAALARHVDGVMLVVESGRISLPQLRESLATLERVGAPLLGIIFNRAKPNSEVSGEYEYLRPNKKSRGKVDVN
jgi:polysaccharide biosynthesis transport protein